MTSAAQSGMIVVAVALSSAANASIDDAPTEPSRPSERLDAIQQQIARFSGHRVDQLVAVQPPFAQMAREYLGAFAPLLLDETHFALREYGWSERRAALQDRIARDMYKWHPVFALTFLETFVVHDDMQLYGLMSSVGDETPTEAHDRRVREIADEYRGAGVPAAEALHRSLRAIDRQAERLHEALEELTERRCARLLADSLRFDPIESRLEIVGRVTNVLVALAMNPRFDTIDQRVRYGPGSDELPDAVHGAAHVVLTQSEVDGALRQQRFAQVLKLFAVLQNEGARDRLLLLFDTFDRYDAPLGDEAPTFHRTLHDGTIGFVTASLLADPEGELGLDVVDQMVRWVVERLRLDGDELRHERIADLLLALREARPGVMEEYIVRFYRDFHALYPAGYENVVLHLVGLMVQYAEARVFVVEKSRPMVKKIRPRQPTVTTPPAANTTPPADALAAHEKVMLLLRWTNTSMVRLSDTLRNVDIEFVDRRQREVLEVIVGYLERELERKEPVLHRQDPRFTETLLELLTRVAHLADPEELTDRVLDPFARFVHLGRHPVGAGIRADVELLSAAVRRR